MLSRDENNSIISEKLESNWSIRWLDITHPNQVYQRPVNQARNERMCPRTHIHDWE
jgi:hypothetical protein